MSKLTSTRNSSAVSAIPVQKPRKIAVRERADRLFPLGNGARGHDIENPRQATVRLKTNIPPASPLNRAQAQINTPKKISQLISSPAKAKREMAILRRDRENLEVAPMLADLDVRTSLFDDRP